MNCPEVSDFFSDHMKQDILSCHRICAGKNSRVYCVRCVDQTEFAVKQYYQTTADGRDRLEQEWAALTFMQEVGIVNVPIPLFSDIEKKIAAYTFLDGHRIEMSSEKDVLSVLDFLDVLKKASVKREAVALKSASEACVAPLKLIETIDIRISKLQEISSCGNAVDKMHDFLDQTFMPEYINARGHAVHLLGLNMWDAVLEQKFQTLSPSDLGFHNALRNPDGGLFFLDFEYFGWDDPVKTISDFVLHPAMNLTKNEKTIFLSGMLEMFNQDELMPIRLKALFPLFKLKWCLILLNEFLKTDIQRRQFASEKNMQIDTVQWEQLAKAEKMLANRVDDEMIASCG